MPTRLSFRCLLLGLALSMPGAAQADSWAQPPLKVVGSTDGRALVRMVPGGFRGDKRPEVELYGYDAKSAQYALKTRFQLHNRIAPVDMLLTGRGELVVLDEWAQMGRGTVLAVYAPDGKPRLEFDLHQLLGNEAADKAPHTVSSTWWRCRKPQLSGDDRWVLVDTYDDGKLRVELPTGNVEYEAGKGRCA